MKIIGNPKREKIVTITTMSLTVGLLLSLVIYINYNKSRLINHGVMTSGFIYSVTTTGRGYFTPLCHFIVNGKEYKNNDNFIELPYSRQYDFIGKTFPIIYLPENPSINHILITPSSFKRYNKKFPDSLVWVKSYIH
jgi:hypothetical protein